MASFLHTSPLLYGHEVAENASCSDRRTWFISMFKASVSIRYAAADIGVRMELRLDESLLPVDTGTKAGGRMSDWAEAAWLNRRSLRNNIVKIALLTL